MANRLRKAANKYLTFASRSIPTIGKTYVVQGDTFYLRGKYIENIWVMDDMVRTLVRWFRYKPLSKHYFVFQLLIIWKCYRQRTSVWFSTKIIRFTKKKHKFVQPCNNPGMFENWMHMLYMPHTVLCITSMLIIFLFCVYSFCILIKIRSLWELTKMLNFRLKWYNPPFLEFVHLIISTVFFVRPGE